jgi:hypothetical protein
MAIQKIAGIDLSRFRATCKEGQRTLSGGGKASARFCLDHVPNRKLGQPHGPQLGKSGSRHVGWC